MGPFGRRLAAHLNRGRHLSQGAGSALEFAQKQLEEARARSALAADTGRDDKAVLQAVAERAAQKAKGAELPSAPAAPATAVGRRSSPPQTPAQAAAAQAGLYRILPVVVGQTGLSLRRVSQRGLSTVAAPAPAAQKHLTLQEALVLEAELRQRCYPKNLDNAQQASYLARDAFSPVGSVDVQTLEAQTREVMAAIGPDAFYRTHFGHLAKPASGPSDASAQPVVSPVKGAAK